jgi:hypothetical protein
MILPRLFSKNAKDKKVSSSGKTKKDLTKLTSGIASGIVLGGSIGKHIDTLDKSLDIKYNLEKHPDKAMKLKELTGNNKKLTKAVLDEVASSITPETIKKVKKGAKYGAIAGGTITGANIIRKRIQKDYSETLPDDWNEKDDKYIDLVEKAKKRNKILFGNPDKTRNIVYTGIGATSGLVSGYKKGRLYKGHIGKNLIGKPGFTKAHPEVVRSISEATKRGAIGLGLSELGNEATELMTGGKVSSSKIKKQAQRDRENANKVLKKYKRMRSSKDRDDFRKKIGVKF